MSRKNEIPSDVRTKLKALLGTRCYICGAEGAEYHHLVPLSWGGTNDVHNFLPLCYEHHMIMHGVRVQGHTWKNKSRGGRHRKIPENYKETLDMFIHGQIGRKECKEMLGVSPASALTDRVWYKEYLEELGIEVCKNLVDVIASNGELKPGKECGYLKYKGKKRCEPMFYNPIF